MTYLVRKVGQKWQVGWLEPAYLQGIWVQVQEYESLEEAIEVAGKLNTSAQGAEK